MTTSRAAELRRPPLSDRAWGPRLLGIALLLALLFHGTLLSLGSFRGTFDADVHIFFADHYARAWFDNWEPRWYTGFTVTSYPPGSHMMIALASYLIGLSWGFVLVQTLAILLLVVGVYRFSRLWVDPAAAGIAAVLCALNPALGEAVHTFGQLPTVISLAFLLNALPFLRMWLLTGRLLPFLAMLSGFAATTACHHVTTLFGSVFFAGPVIVATLVAAFRHPSPGENASLRVAAIRSTLLPLILRRVRRTTPMLIRLMVALAGIGASLILVDLAYWLWSSSDPITQIPIPHASRDSYITNLNAGLLFFVVPWGPWILTLPYAVWKGLSGKGWPLALSLMLLTLLGTGGTTPLPKMLLFGAYQILTLDRFAFWATFAILPFSALFVRSFAGGMLARVMDAQLGRPARRAIQFGFLAAALGSTVFAVTLTVFRPIEPAAVDPKPVVEFLAKDEHWRYRYLTLGLGDQMAWLSAQTTATTVDGNYHSARRLPELTSTPVERLDGAKYTGVPGLGSLQRFLGMPERYRLKFVFSNDRFYDPLLYFSGWRQIGRLENGLVIWQHDDIPPLPTVLPTKEIPFWERLLWGILPPAAIFGALAMFLLSAIAMLRRARGPRFRLLDGDRAARPWSRIDRFLERHSRIPVSAGRVPVRDWHVWTSWLRPRLPRPAAPRIQRARAGLLLGLSLGIALGGFRFLHQPPTPDGTIRAYYVALDNHDFTAAYAMLNPATRPSPEQFNLEISVRGGLLGDAYAKLDKVDVAIRTRTADKVEATATVTWTTSLSSYVSTDPMELTQRGDAWVVEPAAGPAPLQGDEIVSIPSIIWNQRGRRSITDSVTPYADVLDRPHLAVLDARAVMLNGQIAVVGEVLNVSSTPAYLTIGGTLLDIHGTGLVDGAAATVMDHTLAPGESTPFRIDFEGIPGAATRDLSAVAFVPGAYTPLDADILSQIDAINVGVRAVVTDLAVDPAPSLSGLRLTRDATGACLLSAQVGSPAADAYSVPRLLVTTYDASGRIQWVASRLLPYGIRAGGLADATAAIDPAPQTLSLPINLAVNGVPERQNANIPHPAGVAAPAGCGASTVAVRADAFPSAP